MGDNYNDGQDWEGRKSSRRNLKKIGKRFQVVRACAGRDTAPFCKFFQARTYSVAPANVTDSPVSNFSCAFQIGLIIDGTEKWRNAPRGSPPRPSLAPSPPRPQPELLAAESEEPLASRVWLGGFGGQFSQSCLLKNSRFHQTERSWIWGVQWILDKRNQKIDEFTDYNFGLDQAPYGGQFSQICPGGSLPWTRRGRGGQIGGLTDRLDRLIS